MKAKTAETPTPPLHLTDSDDIGTLFAAASERGTQERPWNFRKRRAAWHIGYALGDYIVNGHSPGQDGITFEGKDAATARDCLVWAAERVVTGNASFLNPDLYDRPAAILAQNQHE